MNKVKQNTYNKILRLNYPLPVQYVLYTKHQAKGKISKGNYAISTKRIYTRVASFTICIVRGACQLGTLTNTHLKEQHSKMVLRTAGKCKQPKNHTWSQITKPSQESLSHYQPLNSLSEILTLFLIKRNNTIAPVWTRTIKLVKPIIRYIQIISTLEYLSPVYNENLIAFALPEPHLHPNLKEI